MGSISNGIWIVITDSNTCKFYDYSKEQVELSFLKEIQHIENKLRDIDLTSDKPGHYKSGVSARGTYSQPSDPKEIKIESFAMEIAKELDNGRNNHAYHNIIIFAPPHINGLLFKHLNEHVKKLVLHNVKKDLLYVKNDALLNIVQEHIKPNSI
jgi:protein required for attachment to host cells